jgi:hypothetical protein
VTDEMDPFTHLMEREGLTFPEAVGRLAAEAGFIPQAAAIMPFPTPQRDKGARNKCHETRHGTKRPEGHFPQNQP